LAVRGHCEDEAQQIFIGKIKYCETLSFRAEYCTKMKPDVFCRTAFSFATFPVASP
jgi:hypothetical protein